MVVLACVFAVILLFTAIAWAVRVSAALRVVAALCQRLLRER